MSKLAEIGVYDGRGERVATKRLTIGEAARLAGYAIEEEARRPVQAGVELWVALQTEPMRETLAAAYLIGRRLGCYLPAMAVYGHHGRAYHWRTVPLFRGYLFLRVPKNDVTDHVEAARGLPGVLGAVHARGDNAEAGYAIISDADVRFCREIEARSFERKRAAQRKLRGPYDGPLKVGDAVRVGDGPMEGWAGIIEKLTDSERVLVLMDILGRRTHVTMPARALSGV